MAEWPMAVVLKTTFDGGHPQIREFVRVFGYAAVQVNSKYQLTTETLWP